MATNFPTSLDSLTNPATTDQLSSPSHASQHANANDAIEQLEAKVGANGSAVTTSHDYKIAQLEAAASDVQNSLGDYIPLNVLGQPSGPAELNADGNLIVPENKIIIEGATADAHELTLQAPDVTSDITVTLPNVSGTLATTADVSTAVTNLVASAPATLDTLNELATALGNDANFATTTATSIGNKVSKAGGDVIQSSLSSVVPLVLKGAASQTANLQEWQDSAGNLLGRITSTGITSFYGGSNIFPGDVRAGTSSYFVAALSVAARIATESGLVVRGFASQTADLTQWQNSSGAVLTKIDSSGAIYLINPNPSANAGAITSPSINFQGSIWNNASGSRTIKGAINVTEYLGNTNPTVSKMSFLLATDNGTPAEVASFTNTGAFSNIGGLDAYGSNVIFRLRNTTDATTLAHTPSPKLELMGRAWNSSSGSAPTRAYLQVNANSINSDPFINRLGFFVATGNNAGGWIYGADATEYMSILGNGTVGINSTTPLATLDIRTTSASNKGILIRGISGQTANLTEWQDTSGTVYAFINPYGQLSIGQSPTIYSNARISINTVSTAVVGQVIRGVASQTADLQQWQNSAGSVLAKVDKDGNFNNQSTFGGVLTTSVAATGGNITTTYGFYNNLPASTDAGIAVMPWAATVKGAIIRGFASQTANLQEWQDSSGNAQAYVRYDGYINTNSSIRIAGDNLSVYRFQGVSDGNYTMNFPGSGNIQLFSAVDDLGGGSRVLGIKNATTVPTSNPTTGGILYVNSGALLYRGIGGAITTIARSGDESSIVSVNTATTVDTVALSSFTTIEYTISIKQGSKVRSSKVLVHTDGTSVDSTEYGIIEMGGGITGILVTASVSSTNSILQVTITDAATTNATVKLIKTML